MGSKAYSEFVVRSFQTRGMILAHAAVLERSLDSILSKYFSRDKDHQRELIELIFATERINFKNKYKLLIEILRRKLEDKLSDSFPLLQKKLDDISSIRNDFAHESDIPSDLNLPDEYFDKYEIVLLKFRDIKRTKAYTSEEINDIQSKFKELSNIIEEIRKLLFPDGQVPPDNSEKES